MKKTKTTIILFTVIFLATVNSAECSNFAWTKYSGIVHGLELEKNGNVLFTIINVNFGSYISSRIYTSGDSGKTWKVHFSGNENFPRFQPTKLVNDKNENEFYFYGTGNGNRCIVFIDLLDNSQIKLYPITFPIKSSSLGYTFDVNSDSKNAVAIYSAGNQTWDFSSVVFSADTLKAWKIIFEESPYDPLFVKILNDSSICFVAERRTYMDYPHLPNWFTFFRTENAGETWSSFDLPTVQGNNPRWYDLNFIDENTGYLLCYSQDEIPSKIYYNFVFKTTDGGKTWNKILDTVLFDEYGKSVILSRRMSIHNEDTFLIYGYEEKCFLTVDRGENWEVVNLPKNEMSSSFSAMYLNDANEIFALGGSVSPNAENFFVGNRHSSITEQTITNLLVAPNPTSAHTTVSVDLETAGNLTVTLNNMLGQELFEIHNGFTSAGEFTKTFSLKELPIGVYYLKIVHNGNVRVEKVIRQ